MLSAVELNATCASGSGAVLPMLESGATTLTSRQNYSALLSSHGRFLGSLNSKSKGQIRMKSTGENVLKQGAPGPPPRSADSAGRGHIHRYPPPARARPAGARVSRHPS